VVQVSPAFESPCSRKSILTPRKKPKQQTIPTIHLDKHDNDLAEERPPRLPEAPAPVSSKPPLIIRAELTNLSQRSANQDGTRHVSRIRRAQNSPLEPPPRALAVASAVGEPVAHSSLAIRKRPTSW
jgi:hypothetical protein